MGFGIVPSFKGARRSIGSILKSIDNIWDHLNVEIKHHDTTDGTTLSSTAIFYPLTNIDSGITGGHDTGIDVGYRDGDKIRMKTVNVKGHIENDLTTNVTFWAYLIKHYENMSGVGVLYNDIWDNSTSHGTPERGIQLRNNDHKKQYKILQRRQIRLSGVEDKDNETYFNMFYKFNRRAGSFVEFEGGDGTNDASNGKLYLLVFASDSSSVDLEFTSRVTYIDN